MSNNGNRPATNQAAMGATRQTTTHRHYTPIRVGRHIVGHVNNGTFYKSVRASIHFLRVPPSIGFDGSTLDDAERAGARYVRVTDTETGHIYHAAISTIRTRGFRVSRGYGEQWAMVLDEWRRNDEVKAEQLSLF